MADTKISQLPKSSSLTGDELFVFAKGNSNGSVSADTVKEFAASEFDESLGAKLDKSVWEKRNAQFTELGRLYPDGSLRGSDENSRCTPMLPINKAYDIILNTRVITGTVGAYFYDKEGNWIGDALTGLSDQTWTEHIVVKEDIPEEAVYFRAGTYSRVTEPVPSWENGPTFESREGATSDAIAASKKALFIDMWNQACAQGGNSYGRYNAKTGFFELNGLTDISYEEAVRIYLISKQGCAKTKFNQLAGCFSGNCNVRTVFPILYSIGNTEMNISAICQNNNTIEAIRFIHQSSNNTISDMMYAFNTCPKLKSIFGILYIKNVSNLSTSFGCAVLEDVSIHELKVNIDLKTCPLISLSSFQYMVNYSNNISAITITVHPDIYAKLTDETNTEWHQVLLAAAEKNIQFATA